MCALLNVNLTDVSLDGPPPLPPAVYTLESKKVEYIPADGEKASQIRVTFKDANAEEGDERCVVKVFSLQKNALVFLKQFLVSAGRQDLAESGSIDTDSLLGLRCQAVVSERTYDADGEPRTVANLKKFIYNKPETQS
jgi:hypothetical protein